MLEFIAILPGYLMRFLSGLLGGNFALSVFVFTLLINLILFPLSIKSQKSSVQQTRIKPKLDELKKRYGDDRQKMMEAQQALYREEGVSMSGGCLPMIIRLVLMLSIYQIILSPLTYMVNVDKKSVENVTSTVTDVIKNNDEVAEKFADYSWVTKNSDNAKQNSKNNQLPLIKIISDNEDLIKDALPEKEYESIAEDYETVRNEVKKSNLNFNFFGIDLTQKPNFNIDVINHWNITWIMPLLAFAAQMLTSILSSKVQKKINPDTPNMMGLMLTMPLISLFIGFSFAGGVTFYWACSSLVGGAIQIFTQVFYGPHKMLAGTRIKELTAEYKLENVQLEKVQQHSDSKVSEGTKLNAEVQDSTTNQ